MDGGNAGNAGAVGSATAISNNLDTSRSQTFSYDVLNRLTDAAGIYGALAYTYDANGNTISNTDHTFVYGENNRLKEAGIGGSPLATYTYNGRGERVKKLGAATTYYYYDSNGQLIAELDGSGNTVREYVYLDGRPLALVTGGNIYTMHTDHLGTPQLVTDNTQAIVWQADYKPFGEATMTTELVTNNLRFPGQYFDGETGLYYNYFRDYDPSIGRYIESDPIGLRGGLSTYLYTVANPISRVDPSGLFGGCGRGQAPDENGICRPDPWDRPEDPCISWECRVYSADTNTQKNEICCDGFPLTLCLFAAATSVDCLECIVTGIKAAGPCAKCAAKFPICFAMNCSKKKCKKCDG